MKPDKLQTLSLDQLADRFVRIALAQDGAISNDDNKEYRRLYFEMNDIEDELKRRDGDQRKVLLPLLKHGNGQVRLKAAIALLAVDPTSARTALQEISNADEYPQAADARGMMSAIDEGRYVPS
jgi:hypothetical protein